MAEVRLKHIAKAYTGDVRVIRDVTIDVKDKEFVVLVGPSGCGKSTLLRMIAGLETITDGELFIGDRKMNDVPASERDIAMVFQNYALYPHMTVFENMAFGLKLRGLPKDEIRERVSKAARLLEIENLLERKPKDMSGGQRQRVAIGRAIVRNPQVFLFDEPLSNLDAKLRGQTRIELQKLHRELSATMIYVTHDQVEAMTLGDRIVVLQNGDVMQYDTPLNLYNHPVNQFVAGFIGTPPMNFLQGRISGNGLLRFESQQEEVIIDLAETGQADGLKPYRGKTVVLGIRAENISHQRFTDRVFHQQRVSVEAVENMGSETLAYFLVENQRFIARLSAEQNVAFGQQIDLFWDSNRFHFFDAETGQAIKN